MGREPFPGRWPRNPLIYEIYPRSFQDSDGDGIGDLNGVRRRLDHLASLGVDAVWMTPITASPWVDGGYDPSSYTDIHPSLGTLQDFDALVAEAHDRGIRVVIDLVLNHTSKQHPWFGKSVAREGKYEDYYVWRDAKPAGEAPTNWITRFGKPAWTWDHRREQYYLHNYMSEQPALNLRNDAVQDEMRAIFRTWRERGADGFRLDAVTSYLCDPQFRDNPPASPEVRAKMDGEQFLPYVRQDHLHDMLPGDGAAYTENLRDWAGEGAFLLGEVGTGNQSITVMDALIEPGRLDAAYTVDIPQNGLQADTLAHMLREATDPGSHVWWTSSHDRARQVAGPDDPEARFQIFLLATMPGTALVYQGQELGLPQPRLERDEATDPYDLSFWPDGPGREGARVPLPWTEDDTTYGFTTADPWLPMRWPSGCSVAAQEAKGETLLAFARDAFALRRELEMNEITIQDWSQDGDVITVDFTARGGDPLMLALNFGDAEAKVRGDAPRLTTVRDAWRGGLPARSGALWSA